MGIEPQLGATGLRTQVFLLLGAGSVILLSSLLRVHGETGILVPGVDWLLPETCVLKLTAGIDCPACGLTRSFISLAHGRLLQAWAHNPFGLLFFAIVAFQIPYRLIQIRRLRAGLDELSFRTFAKWTIIVTVVLMVTRWVVVLSA